MSLVSEASGPAHPEVVDRYNDAYNELASIQAAKATLDTVIADLGGLDVLLGQVLSSGDPDALGDQDGLDDALEAMLTVGVSLLTTVDIAGVDIDPTAAVNVLDATRVAQQTTIDAINSDITAKQADKAADEASLEAIEADLVALETTSQQRKAGCQRLRQRRPAHGLPTRRLWTPRLLRRYCRLTRTRC